MKVLKWAALALVLNLVWEIVQLPLFTIPTARSMAQIVYVIAHCTVGDAVIAAVSFAIASLLLRDADWPLVEPWRGGIIVMWLGVMYTSYSEWRNVYEAGNWGYSSNMPLIYGVGLAPLVQWIFIPVAAILILRASTQTKTLTTER